MSYSTDTNGQENQLIYIGDPMCSWCYGFGPELEKVRAATPTLQLKIVMGGLRPYGKETMGDLSAFLQEHWEEIHKKTGREFKYDILKQADFIYDTEPASRAVVTFRQFNPKQELDFFQKVQEVFYAKNKDVHDVQTYLDLLDEFAVDKKAFAESFSSPEMEKATLADFQYSGQLGIRGFPSMVLKKGEQYILVSNGYQSAEQLVKQIERSLKD